MAQVEMLERTNEELKTSPQLDFDSHWMKREREKEG
jgi:hypothetical protein